MKKFKERDWCGEPEIIDLTGICKGDILMRNEQGNWDSCTAYKAVECTHTTPTQATIGGIKYRIKDARALGESRYSRKLMPLDKAKIKQSVHERQVLSKRRKLEDFKWREASEQQILAVCKILFGNELPEAENQS